MIFVGIFTLVGISLVIATAFELEDEAKIRDIKSLRILCRQSC